jgi:3-hydroxymyristoyl/3-hydroxydecanoyl-(acyl carrier protein) dehydratase
MMSRVLSVEATRNDFTPGAALTAEFDMPAQPWFAPHNGRPAVPYSVLMESALQPCGFFSVWLGSTLATPEEDIYLRILDGDARLSAVPDLAGRTVRTRVVLESSAASGGVTIQRFGFELSCEGTAIYQGTTTLGHFRPGMLAAPVGLDGGRLVPPWLTDAHAGASAGGPPAPSGPPMPQGRLDLLDEVVVVLDGGTWQRGYALGRTAIDATSWFFDAHFFQDPVMPGSLGVEAIVQALKAYAVRAGLGGRFDRPRFGLPDSHRTAWKFRGQIMRTDREMVVDVHVHTVRDEQDRIVVVGDGSLWKDGLRIYHVTNVAVTVSEGD